MLDPSFDEQQTAMVDERLAKVVHVIVEEYDGDVKAFVESIRDRTNEVREKITPARWGSAQSIR
jgi:hypothetical protein